MTTLSAVAHLEREVGILLRRSRALARLSAEKIHPDVNFEAFSILVRLDDVTQARPSDIARFLRVGRPTLSRQVKLLETLGLVQRTAHPTDARASILSLSESGRLKVRVARSARHQELVKELGEWGPDALASFAGLTRRLNKALSPDGDDDTMAAEKLLGSQPH